MVNKIVTSLSWELSKGQGAGTGTGLGGAKHHTSASAAGITAAGRQGDGNGCSSFEQLYVFMLLCIRKHQIRGWLFMFRKKFKVEKR